MNTSALTQINDVNGLILRIVSIGTVVIYLIVGLGLIYIIWAIVQYLIKGKEGDENRREAGMKILWGVVGLAVVMSLWGLVNLIINTFWLNTNQPNLPNANFVSQADNGNAGVSQYSQPIGPPTSASPSQSALPSGYTYPLSNPNDPNYGTYDPMNPQQTP